MADIPLPTPEDYERNLLQELPFAEQRPGPDSVDNHHYRLHGVCGWPAAIRRALFAEAELARLRQQAAAPASEEVWLDS